MGSMEKMKPTEEVRSRCRKTREEPARGRGCLLTKPGYNLAATGKTGAPEGPSAPSTNPRAAAGPCAGIPAGSGSIPVIQHRDCADAISTDPPPAAPEAV